MKKIIFILGCFILLGCSQQSSDIQVSENNGRVNLMCIKGVTYLMATPEYNRHGISIIVAKDINDKPIPCTQISTNQSN